jgi:hypothetical protein
MEGKENKLITVPWSRGLARCKFLGGSHAGITVSADDVTLIRLWHEQSVQVKSEKCLGVLTGDPPRSRAQATKSATAQAQRSRPIRGKCSRVGHRQWQTSAIFTTFMTGVRTIMKAYAILWQKLYACFSERTFDQGNQVLVSCAATHLDIRDCVFDEDRSSSQVPNRSTRHPNLYNCHSDTVLLSHVAKSQPASSCRRINRGIQ